MHSISLSEGITAGALASFVYRIIKMRDYYSQKGYWPWDDPVYRQSGQLAKPWMFALSFIFDIFVAGFAVWAYMEAGQITGILGAMTIGITGDELIRGLSVKARKEYKND